IEGLLAGPRLPEWGSRNLFPGLQPDRGAPFDAGSEDEIVQRVVGGAVPLLPAHGARTKMDVFVDSERLLHILDSRLCRPIEQLIVCEVEAVKESVLWRDRHEPLAPHRLD